MGWVTARFGLPHQLVGFLVFHPQQQSPLRHQFVFIFYHVASFMFCLSFFLPLVLFFWLAHIPPYSTWLTLCAIKVFIGAIFIKKRPMILVIRVTRLVLCVQWYNKLRKHLITQLSNANWYQLCDLRQILNLDRSHMASITARQRRLLETQTLK